MRNQKPPFEITNQIISDVAEIAELMGKFSVTNKLSTNPTLRRSNRFAPSMGPWPLSRIPYRWNR